MIFLIIILTESCAVNKNNITENQNFKEDHFNQLGSLKHWVVEGKIGYRDLEGGGSAWVSWSQSKEKFEVKLSGPFGINTKRIKGSFNNAELKPEDYHISVSQHSDIYQKKSIMLGTQIEHLQYWIKGMGSPSLPNIESRYNDDGTLALLKQAGWRLDFSDYKSVGKFKLPNKIKGKKGVYEFNLSIKKWLIK